MGDTAALHMKVTVPVVNTDTTANIAVGIADDAAAVQTKGAVVVNANAQGVSRNISAVHIEGEVLKPESACRAAGDDAAFEIAVPGGIAFLPESGFFIDIAVGVFAALTVAKA